MLCCINVFYTTKRLGHMYLWDFPRSSVVKNQPAMFRRHRKCEFNPWVKEDALEEGMAAHISILAWEIPWTEEPGGLQSMESQRVRHDWSDWAACVCVHVCVHVCVCVCVFHFCDKRLTCFPACKNLLLHCPRPYLLPESTHFRVDFVFCRNRNSDSSRNFKW